jgi:Na+-driven multidrug efflux pump
VCLLLLALAAPLVGLFTTDPALRATATDALRVLAFTYPFAGVAMLVSARFQALGQPRPSYLISIGTIVAVKVPLLLALSRHGTRGLLISFPIAELITAGLGLLVLQRRTMPDTPPAAVAAEVAD